MYQLSKPEQIRVEVFTKPHRTVEIREYVLLGHGQWHRTGTFNMPESFWEATRKPMMIKGAFAIGLVLNIDTSRQRK